MNFRKHASIGIWKKYTILDKKQKNFDETQYSYNLKVLSLKMLLFCSYFVRSILLLLGYFNTTLEEFKGIYLNRRSDYITKNEFYDDPIIFFKVARSSRYFDVLFLNFPASILFLICSYFLTNFSLIVYIKFLFKTKCNNIFGNFPVKYPCEALLKYACRPPWEFSRKLFRTAIWEESL